MNANTKKTVDAIKKLLSFVEDVKVEAATTEYKLADGTAVTIDKLETGGVMSIAGAVAPDGAYTLEDGTCITVAAGVIATVEAAKPTDVLPEDMKTPAQMQAAIDKFATDVTQPNIQKFAIVLKACFEYCFGWQIREAQEKATRDAAIATYKENFTAVNKALGNQKEANKLLLSLLEDVMNESVEKPAEKIINADWDKMTPLERRKAQRALEA